MAVMAAADSSLTLSIPEKQTDITVDGNISAREWFSSAGLPFLHDMNDWFSIDKKIQLKAQYDKEYFYLAFEIRRPESHLAPRIIPAGETQYFAEDFFWIILRDDRGEKKTIKGNAKKAVLENSGVQPKIPYAVKITSAGWQGEIAIPRELCGRNGFYMDFINSMNTPFSKLSSLGFRSEVQDNNALLYKIIPCGCRAFISFISGNTHFSLPVTIAAGFFNPGNERTTVKFRSLSENVSKYGKNYGKFLQEILSKGTTPETGKIQIPPASGKYFAVKLPKKLGNYAVFLQASENGKKFCSVIMLIRNQYPCFIKTENYFLTRNIVELSMELPNGPETGSVKIECLGAPSSSKIYWEKKLKLAGKKKYLVEMPASFMEPEKTYTVKMAVKNKTNKLCSFQQIEIYRPTNPSWDKNNLGKRAFVPPPWKNLEFKDGTITGTNKRIEIGNALLPTRIECSGKSLLASPVSIDIRMDGNSLELPVSRLTVRKKTPEKIKFRKKWEKAKLLIEAELTVEFDGFMWYSLKLSPENNAVQIDSLCLEIPMREKFATLFNTYGQGTVNKKRRLYYEATPHGRAEPGMKFPFYAFFFLGCEEGGLQYCCESERFWNTRKNPIRLEKHGESVILKVDFIDRKTELKQVVKFEFGIMPAPVRYFERGGKFWSTNSLCWYGFSNNTQKPKHFRPKESFEKFNNRVVKKWLAPISGNRHCADRYRKYKVKLCSVYGWNPFFGAPLGPDNLFDKKFRAMIEATRKICPDMKITPYTGWGVNEYAIPQFSSFGKEMTRRPFAPSRWNTFMQCPASSYNDYFVDAVARMIRKYGVDGVYLDSTGNVPCCNRTGHGCGYFDKEGKLHGTYPVRATRNLMKRLYKLTHGELIENGIIYLHMGPPLLLPIASFSDVIITNEPGISYWRNLRDIGLEKFRSTSLSSTNGLALLQAWHYWMEKHDITSNQFLGYVLLHGEFPRTSPVGLLNYGNRYQQPGYDKKRYPFRHVYAFMDKYADGGKCEFYPYWNNSKYLSASPKSVYGSFYVNHLGRIFLILCNLDKQKVEAKIHFFFPSGGEIAGIEDVFTKQTIKYQNKSFKTEIGEQGYRLFLIKKKSNSK